MRIIVRKLETVDDVKDFFKLLLDNDVVFHPDNCFHDYVTQYNARCFSVPHANRLNRLMERAFEICNEAKQDIYGVAIDVHKAHPSWIIPPPYGFH